MFDSEDLTSSHLDELVSSLLSECEDPTSSPPDTGCMEELNLNSFDMPSPPAFRPASSVDSDRPSADEFETSSLKADLDLDLDLREEPMEWGSVSIEDRQALRHSLPRSREEANER